MNVILGDLQAILNDILQPAMFGFILSLCGTVWFLMKRIRKALNRNTEDQLNRINSQIEVINESNTKLLDVINKSTDAKIKALTDKVDDTTVEVLRIQILEGIDTKRLSESEIHYFYDKYKGLGGNSFVTAKVAKYLEHMEECKKGRKHD